MPVQGDPGSESLNGGDEDCGQGEESYHLQEGWGFACV
jgi:hypothetical protein